MEWFQLDFGGIAAIMSALAAIIIAWWRTRPETADTAATYQQIARKSAEDVKTLREDNRKLREDVKELTERVDDLEREVDIYHHGVERLVNQLKSLNQKPVWTPPKREPAKSS